MQQDRPSITALRVAMARAAHQVIDAAPRVFDDPFALRILGAERAAEVQRGGRRLRSIFARRMRAFVVARSRVAEDELAQGVERGVRQYVVLGAGLDTFALRNPYAAQGLRAFEVDHPATQAWKRQLLAQAGLQDAATFVPVDFAAQSWLDALRASGFRDDVPTHVAWLGVAMYLSPADVTATLGAVASLARGSSIVFDYLLPASELGLAHRALIGVLGSLLSAIREPLRSSFTPAALGTLLQGRGYVEIADLGAEELNARFFSGRATACRPATSRASCARGPSARLPAGSRGSAAPAAAACARGA